MTSSPADSIATASTSAGSFPTSRRCSTTTPSCCAITSTASRASCARTSWPPQKRSSRWLDSTMTDRERGGFYASQDADIDLDDDGDYFTWTLDEARAELDPAELDVAGRYYDIGELGDMHHNPAKNVLHRKKSLEEIAAEIGKPVEELRSTAGIGPHQAHGRARRAPHSIYRPHALHRLECDGGYGLSRSGARSAHGFGSRFRAAHAAPPARRGLERRRPSPPRDRLSRTETEASSTT